ncbi:hypothetical protein QQ045_015212 [Rhodiola kirilowii]
MAVPAAKSIDTQQRYLLFLRKTTYSSHGKGPLLVSRTRCFEYKLSLSFPAGYPLKSPKVKFETGGFHPNVNLYGNICFDIILYDMMSAPYLSPSKACSKNQIRGHH